jgi:TolB protein
MENRAVLSARRLAVILLATVVVACSVTVQAIRAGRAKDPAGHHEPTSTQGQIAFVSNRDGNHEIYVMAADGTDVVRLTDDPAADVSPAWSPDGARIAFVSDRDGNDEIYVMAADGSHPTNLTASQADEAWPQWSPDGSKIVYCSSVGSTVSIYTMDADGSNRHLLHSGYMSLVPSPAWSPDGAQLAMECWGEGSDPPDICVMDADGTNVHHLTNTAGGQSPTWSPDGSTIAFERDDDIYAIDADGSHLTNLTASPAEEHRPVWSPLHHGCRWQQPGRAGRSRHSLVLPAGLHLVTRRQPDCLRGVPLGGERGDEHGDLYRDIG